MVSSAQNKLKNRPETAAIATTHKLTKKDDADSTKTIAVTTNNQYDKEEETTDGIKNRI